MSFDERFRSQCHRIGPEGKGGCVVWTGARDRWGYGSFDGRPAHRVAYEAELGPIPKGLQIDHLCRNRWCVNPSHLEPVTPSENRRRGLEFRDIESAYRVSNPTGEMGQKLKAYRRHRSMTQTALAAILGVSQPALSLSENGVNEVPPRWLAELGIEP